MKKATPQTPAENTATEADIAVLANFFTLANDQEKEKLLGRKAQISRNIEDEEQRIRNRERDIQELEENIKAYKTEQIILAEQIDTLPTVEPVLPEVAKADMEKLLALSYVKSVEFKQIADNPYLVVQTRPNSLYTTLEKKYSRSGRWYKAKPYRIPLPAYNIRIGLGRAHRTLATNTDGLAIALANAEEDTGHFVDWTRYTHQPHPHWGTTSVYRDERGAYRGVCLGEYENEVTRAFRTSIAEGIVALAVYLQVAGTRSAYVNDRAWWALWLGKKEYNLAMIPSEKEVKELVEDEEREPHQEPDEERYSCDSGDDCDMCSDEECGCSCHED